MDLLASWLNAFAVDNVRVQVVLKSAELRCLDCSLDDYIMSPLSPRYNTAYSARLIYQRVGIINI